MKSVVFLKSYYGVIHEGAKGNINDSDFIGFSKEGHVQEIEFDSSLGAYIKSFADLQVKKKDNENYKKAKLLFGETFKEKDAEDLRCDIVSNYIIDEYKLKTIRDAKGDEYWYKLNSVFVPNGRTIIIETCYDFFGKHMYSGLISKVELLTKAKTYVDPSLFFGSVCKTHIGVANGLLNLDNYEIEDNPKCAGNIFVRIPIVYNKTQTCPHFEKFLEDILEKPEHVNTIQELMGFCLLPEYKYEKMFIFTGIGRNGKTKLISIFKTFLGAHNCTSHSLQTLQNKEYCLAELHNKLANVGGDISNEALKSTDIIKQITGQDLISANRKFKDYIQFISFAKQIFACNELPIIYDSSLGFWNRINRLDFPYVFYEQGEYDKLTTEQLKYGKLRDENILDNILTTEELSGILNFALQGLFILRHQKEFSNSTETEKIRNEWLRKTSSFYSFVADMFDFDTSSQINSDQLNELYDIYCEYFVLEQVPANQRTEHVRRFSGKPVTVNQKKIDGEKHYVWKGIRLKSIFDSKLQSLNGNFVSYNTVLSVPSVLAFLSGLEVQKKFFIR